MSPHDSDHMSQRSQISRVALWRCVANSFNRILAQYSHGRLCVRLHVEHNCFDWKLPLPHLELFRGIIRFGIYREAPLSGAQARDQWTDIVTAWADQDYLLVLKMGRGLNLYSFIKSKTTNIIRAMSNSDLTTLLSYLVARQNMYKRVETHWVAALPAIYLCTFT